MHWATGSRPRAWAGLFTAEASFTAQIDFELFPFFSIWSWKYVFILTLMSHMWRRVPLIPGQPTSVPLRFGKTATEKIRSRAQVLV